MKEKEAKSNTKKPIYRKWWFWVIIVVILAAIFGNMGGNDEGNSKQVFFHIYNNAQVKDVMNGSRTEKIGEYSFIETTSDEVTEEALIDWYFNYVANNDFNWCMILYSDKDDNSGVYAISGMVQKDVLFEKDHYDDFMVGNSANATLYVPTDDNKLEIIKFGE